MPEGAESPRSSRRRSGLAWLVGYGATLLLLSGSLFSVRSPVRWVFIDWLSYAVCFGIVLCWSIGLGASWRRIHSRPSRRILLSWISMPALALTCAALVSNDVPASGFFALSEPSLVQAADGSQAGRPIEPRSFGFMDVSEVRALSEGTTLFFLSDAEALTSSCGIAYNPHRTPDLSDQPNDSLGDKLADGWWVFCENL